jgi:Fe-S-cluster containining protein
MSSQPFYASGLRFSCTRCSNCCRHTSGYVFLSSPDLDAIAGALAIDRPEALRRYCRQVDSGLAVRVSLKEKANLDCIFWENGGCSIYEARPLQCRSFPFWSSCLSSHAEWEHHAAQCPGMGQGALHPKRAIESWLRKRLEEGFLEGEGRKAGR